MQSPKKLRALQYSLETFHRSNQDTSLVHKPTVFEGDWVQPGDLLADCSASEGGELALGHNILVAYMPWEGYNFEDAILISEKLVYDDVFTSIHIERYETETQQTKLGSEKITREVPEVTPDQVKHLDSSGFAKIGSWVEEGDILVGKISPLPEQVQSPSQKFLYKLLDKKFKLVRDSSLRAPKSIKSKVIKIEVFSSSSDSDSYFDSSNYDSDKTHKQTLVSLPTSPTLAKPAKLSKLSKGGKVGKRGNIPKDSKKLNSLPLSLVSSNKQHTKWPKKESNFVNPIKHYYFIKPLSLSLSLTRLSVKVSYLSTKINQQLYLQRMNLFMYKPLVLPLIAPLLSNQGKGIRTTRRKTVGVVPTAAHASKPLVSLFPSNKKKQNYGNTVLRKNRSNPILTVGGIDTYGRSYDKSLEKPLAPPLGIGRSGACACSSDSDSESESKGEFAELNNRTLLGTKQNIQRIAIKAITTLASHLVDKDTTAGTGNPTLKEIGPSKPLKNYIPVRIQVYLAEKRKIQVGDKMAGRHGNKGIISQILPRQDMPYLPDGTAVDIVLNPLGVPSRMNVGQIYECLLGLAGKYLGQHFKIFPFDEIYGPEASRSFVYSKLHEAQQKTGLKWLFNPNTPGKLRLFDGRTGDCFEQPITVGRAYMLKLVHMVDDKIHARSTGPYSLVTQQPLRGRSKQGGQRMGEMEVWAIEGYGAAFTLLEMLTIKSDDMTGRMTLWHNLIFNKEISIGTPESFKVLISELQALCLDIGLFK